MTVELLPAISRIATPWRNGGGWTREVAASRSGESAFRWRVSIADVATAGPFSAFPGYHRVIMMVQGAGMALTVDGATTVIDRCYQPFGFPGSAETTCRLLDGPIVDFNVIYALDERVSIEVLRGPITLVGVGLAIVVALDLTADVAGLTLGPLDALRVADEPAVSINGGPVAVVRFQSPDR